MSVKKRLLFVAESVTLAQVVRLVTLGRALDSERYEIHFACSDPPKLVFAGTDFVLHPLVSRSPAAVERDLRAGRRLYEEGTLRSYVEAETNLIRSLSPALVVGDFRLSLSSSAELCGVPCAVLINAYWSPYARRDAFPVPDHPILKWLGEGLTARYFPKFLPRAFRHFAAPVNAVRRRYGLAPIGELLEVLTHADYTLYPDHPSLTPIFGAPARHRFLGPVLWQPDVPAEPGQTEDYLASDDGRPLLYVTLGSSGNVQLLPMIIRELAKLPVLATIATAGRFQLGELPPNVRASAFVRGAEVARRASLVVSNGGSTTGYQALSVGTPVLGLPSNLDQHLATQAIDRSGAGISIKARSLTPANFRESVLHALQTPELVVRAEGVAREFASCDSAQRFRNFVDEVVGDIAAPEESARPRPHVAERLENFS